MPLCVEGVEGVYALEALISSGGNIQHLFSHSKV